MIKQVSLILLLGAQLSACATATRGTTTLLVVNSAPSGARVISNLETQHSRKIGTIKRKNALKNKTEDSLEFEYLGCDPTPCGIEVPRKARFEILVSKDGHAPQLFFIGRIHRKDVARKNTKNVGLATGAAAGAGAAAAIATGATFAGASLAAPVAIFAAFPIALAGGTSILVDSASGANFDLTPNPVLATLQTDAENINSQADIEAMQRAFHKRRRDRALGIKQDNLQKKKIKMCQVSRTKTIPCDKLKGS